MLPLSHLETFLQRTPPQLQDIVFELRNIIAFVAPTASEMILWKGISYYFKERGGPISAGLCQINVLEDHVRLGFIHGAYLPDPHGLLEGGRKVRRFVRLCSYESAPWDEMRDLIAASSRFDPYTLKFRRPNARRLPGLPAVLFPFSHSPFSNPASCG